VTTAGYATALYWPWLNQIYEAYRVRCGKAASVGGLVFMIVQDSTSSNRFVPVSSMGQSRAIDGSEQRAASGSAPMVYGPRVAMGVRLLQSAHLGQRRGS
jgi:hypothetical protein